MDIQQLAQQLGVDVDDVSAMLASEAIQTYSEYKNSGSKDDIDIAVGLARESIRTGHYGDRSLVGKLNNLGVMLGRRYERTGEMTDLEEAIEVARQAVESTPHDHPNRAIWLNNLGNILDCRYRWTGEAIRGFELVSADSFPCTLINSPGMLASKYTD